MTLNSVPPSAENRPEPADRVEIPMSISVQLNDRHGDALTTRQAECLRAIEYRIANFGRAPTRIDLCAMLGIRSQRSLREDYLDALEKKGFIRVVPKVAGGIVVLVPSSAADIDDSKSPLRRPGPGLAKASPRAAADRKVG